MASTSQMRGVPISRRNTVTGPKVISPGQQNRKSWSKLEADQSVENRLAKLRQKGLPVYQSCLQQKKHPQKSLN